MPARFPHITPADRVAWSEAKQYVLADGAEVTHYGMDRAGNFYYRTDQGTYIKQPHGWVRI